MGTTAGSTSIAGTLAVTGASTLTGATTLTGAASLSGALAVTGKTTHTGQVTNTAGMITGEADSASNEYDFFYVDGTNRPKFNAFNVYDYGGNKWRGVYLYNGAFKATT